MDDLEAHLKGLEPQPGLSFQTWNEMQVEKAPTLNPKLPTSGAFNDLDYWGFNPSTPCTRSDYLDATIEIDKETTALLLGDANRPFQTGPVEIFLASIWDAFFQTFQDRKQLTLWNEGHGRQPWQPQIDLSRTVGWFTTVSPINVERDSAHDITDLVRFVKEVRKDMPVQGWAYFVKRFLADGDDESYRGHGPPIELEFNYHGQFQQFEQEDSLFMQPGLSLNDEGPEIPVASIFGIEAYIAEQQAGMILSYNQHIKHQEHIRAWAAQIPKSLKSLCYQLASMQSAKTGFDYQFLNVKHDQKDDLQQRLDQVGSVNNAQVVEVLPCSPTVIGILLSQTREPELYNTSEVYEIEGTDLDPIRLAAAWQKVIAQQPNLRSVFTRGLDESSAFHQLVLDNVRGEVMHFDCEDQDSAIEQLSKLRAPDYQQAKPPHRLILCRTKDGAIICQMEMSHTITDGQSGGVILSNWASAYQGSLPAIDLLGTCRALAQTYTEANTLEYWKQKLRGAQPCHFPRLGTSMSSDESFSVSRDIPDDVSAMLSQVTKSQSVTLVSIYQAAWALTLSSYCGSDAVCFGYLTSGRDRPIAGIDHVVGALANLMVCHVDDLGNTQDLVPRVYKQMVEDLNYQHCSIAEIQHELSIGSDQSLFNSSLSCQKMVDNKKPADAEQITFNTLDGKDPTEFDIAVRVLFGDSQSKIGLESRPSYISEKQAERVLSMFLSMITTLARG